LIIKYKGKRASEWGSWEAMAYIVTGISALLGGWVASVYGFRILFMGMLVLSIAAVVVSLFLHKKN